MRRALLLSILAALAGAHTAVPQGLTAMQILEGAPERIRQCRTTDLTITVTDAAGKPVPGAKVEVRQTRHEFLFGCNIFGWNQPTDEDKAKYRDQFEGLLNYATLPFYWAGFEPQRGQPQYPYLDLVANWCVEHGIKAKGHPLVWNHNAGNPGWLPADPAEVTALSDARVRDVVTHFRGKIDIWDVVNEAADPFRGPEEFGGRMTDAWRAAGQMPFAIKPFKIAREANPNATLLINDYRVDPAYERVIEQLVDENGKRLYDVIGIQSHMHGGAWPTERIWEVCERFARFGVPLHFTETTIVSGPRTPEGWETTPEGEARQAEEVARFYTILFSHPAVQAVTWWDFADRGAWQGAPSGFLRKDLSPKPVYEKLMGLIKGAWWTKAEMTTDAQGLGRVRAFYGDYEVRATAAGRQTTATFHLTRDGDHTLKVTL
jgi:endo-1,4-beta-xylanase